MTTLREFIEDFDQSMQETIQRGPIIRKSSEGPFEKLDADVFSRTYSNGSHVLTEQQMRESISGYLDTLRYSRSISAVALGEIPASGLLVKYAGVISGFKVARNGAVSFYDKEGKDVSCKVRCRSRSRRLIRRAARREIGKCWVYVVMPYAGPVEYVECRTTIAR